MMAVDIVVVKFLAANRAHFRLRYCPVFNCPSNFFAGGNFFWMAPLISLHQFGPSFRITLFPFLMLPCAPGSIFLFPFLLDFLMVLYPDSPNLLPMLVVIRMICSPCRHVASVAGLTVCMESVFIGFRFVKFGGWFNRFASFALFHGFPIKSRGPGGSDDTARCVPGRWEFLVLRKSSAVHFRPYSNTD